MEFLTNIEYSRDLQHEACEGCEKHPGYEIHCHPDYFIILQTTNYSHGIDEYKSYLRQTDGVVSKISEAIIEGNQENIDQLKVKYAEILTKRAEARTFINEHE